MAGTEYSFQEFLERYYRAIGPEAERDPEIQALLKTDDRFDFASNDYFNPVYSAKISLEGLTRSSTIYKLFPKTTYLQEGDSMHYISADATYLETWLGEEGVMFNKDTAIPTISDIDHIYPAVFQLGWEDTRVGREMSKFQHPPKTDIAFLQNFFNERYIDKIDQQLAGVEIDAAGTSTGHGVDTPAARYSKAQIESIDRMITNSTESGDTNHVDTATDGDVYWNDAGSGSAVLDRDSDTWSYAQIKLPGTAGTEDAYNILDELDDLMATALVYAPTSERNYIGLCSPKGLNKIQDELDPKMRFLDGPMDYTQTINGVSTRPGAKGGKYSVASLVINGIQVPMFTSPYLMGTSTSSWTWKNTQYSTGGVGHIFLINTDNIEIRHLIPITYVEVPNYGDWILGSRHSIFSAMQLIARRFACHAALKYIKA